MPRRQRLHAGGSAASYPIHETLDFYGRVENAFDEDYQTILNYGTPGRGAFIGVRAKF
jgi:vitamin B12 transporter